MRLLESPCASLTPINRQPGPNLAYAECEEILRWRRRAAHETSTTQTHASHKRKRASRRLAVGPQQQYDNWLGGGFWSPHGPDTSQLRVSNASPMQCECGLGNGSAQTLSEPKQLGTSLPNANHHRGTLVADWARASKSGHTRTTRLPTHAFAWFGLALPSYWPHAGATIHHSWRRAARTRFFPQERPGRAARRERESRRQRPTRRLPAKQMSGPAPTLAPDRRCREKPRSRAVVLLRSARAEAD